jgi:hypothetical protein
MTSRETGAPAAELAELRAQLAAAQKELAASKAAAETVKIVIQRCDSCEYLLNPDTADEKWAETGRALVIYISFAKGAEAEKLPQIVRTLLRYLRGGRRQVLAWWEALPLITPLITRPPRLNVLALGGWTQHKVATEADLPKSILELVGAGHDPAVVVIPQAGLISKIGTGARGLKYHNQCSKEIGFTL